MKTATDTLAEICATLAVTEGKCPADIYSLIGKVIGGSSLKDTEHVTLREWSDSNDGICSRVASAALLVDHVSAEGEDAIVSPGYVASVLDLILREVDAN